MFSAAGLSWCLGSRRTAAGGSSSGLLIKGLSLVNLWFYFIMTGLNELLSVNGEGIREFDDGFGHKRRRQLSKKG
jgi:hypothetical protein